MDIILFLEKLAESVHFKNLDQLIESYQQVDSRDFIANPSDVAQA